MPFLTNCFVKRHVFHQPILTTGVKGANLLETRDFVSSNELPTKDQRKLSIPTSNSAPCEFMTTSNQQQFKYIDIKG
jgi:hypothetical protein